MAIGRPMPPLILDDTERETLERWVRRPKTTQGLALRARMILACTEGRSNIAVAADLEVSDETVGKWRSRFLERRLDGLSDEPRSGRPRAVTDHADAGVTERSGLSHTTVSRIWRAFALQPHRTASSCRRTPSSSKRCGTLWASTLIRRTGRWSCAWTRSPRFCARARWSGAVPPPPPGRGVPQVPRCPRCPPGWTCT